MRAALERGYTNADGKYKKYLQGKVFEVEGQTVYYRDISPNRSEMYGAYQFRSWNIDHMVYEWLREQGIEKMYYFEKKSGQLYRTTVRKVENAIGRGEAVKDKQNNHTQYFLPRHIFDQELKEEFEIKTEAGKYIRRVVNVADSMDRKVEINYAVKRELSKMYKQVLQERGL